MVRRAVEISPFVLKEKEMEYRLIFRNTLTKEVSVFTMVDTSSARNFYRFQIPMGLVKGEYEYYVCEAGGFLNINPNDVRKSLVDDHQIVVYDCGVARVGYIERRSRQYNLEKTYEQYN